MADSLAAPELDYTLVSQLQNLIPGVAFLQEDLFRMLAQLGCARPDFWLHAAEADGEADGLHWAQGLVLNIDDVPVGRYLFIGGDVLNPVDRGADEAPIATQRQPLFAGFGGHRPVDQGDQFLAVIGPGPG